MLIKRGAILKIEKTAASATELLIDRPLSTEQKVVEGKNPEFLYFVAKAIAAGDEGPIDKQGNRVPNPNGNFDYFPKKEIEASYQSFIGKGIYLDHNASSVMYSVGKILDAFPTVDVENKEWSISCLAKIDRKLHPEIARKVETGELNTVSMGCSCAESKCNICGTILHTDDDPKCAHLEPGRIGREYTAEIDLPEYGIHKGSAVKSFAINAGIGFNELSLVGVPAWPRAFVTTIFANLKNTISKKASLTKEEQLDLVAQFEKLVETLEPSIKEQVKAEFCGCPITKETNTMSDTPQKQASDETTDLLKKISAYDMEKLENHIQHKTRKAEATAAAETKTQDDGWVSSIVEKVASRIFGKSADLKPCKECGDKTPNKDCHCGTCECGTLSGKKSSLTAEFKLNKETPALSTWSLYDGENKLILDASLNEIWGDQLEANQDFAVSEDYGHAIVARYLDPKLGGIERLADLWDVSYKLNKEANMEKQANPGDVKKPEGQFFVPGSDSSNKWNDKRVKIDYTLTEHKPGEDQKGPAAPKGQEVKTIYNIPGSKPGESSKGPAAPKPAEVKTEYAIGKPEGKKFDPSNPEEKAHEKSESKVKTGYKGDLMYDEEKKDEKGGKKEAAKTVGDSPDGAVAEDQYPNKKPKTSGEDPDSSYKEAAKTVGDKPEGSVKEDQYPKASEPNKDPDASVKENNMPKGTPDLTKTPDSSVQEKMPAPAKSDKDPDTSVKDTEFKKHPNLTSKPDHSSKEDQYPAPANPNKEPDSSVQKDSSQKKADLPVEEPKMDEMPKLEEGPMPEEGQAPKPVSAFDTLEGEMQVGDGYTALKDKETKEIVVSKDGKEVKRLPDGFGPDVAAVTGLLKAVLGLPATEEKKDEKPSEKLSPVEETVEKVEVHPEESSPSEMPSLKASALEVELEKKASELKAKEEQLNKKAEEIKKWETDRQTEKFQTAVASRTQRCRRVIEAMLEKNVLTMDDAVLQEKLHEGTYLLDARKAALDHSISAKMKELLASNDVELAAIEKTVNDIKVPEAEVSKKANRVPFIQWDEFKSSEDEISSIFSQMGKKNHWQ